MLKSVNPLVQVCQCGRENVILSADVSVKSSPTSIALPACPACGGREFLFVLTVEQNPGEHAEMVRELARRLGVIPA